MHDTLIVLDEHDGMRLDRFLAGQMPALSRSNIKTLIDAGQVRRNGRLAKPAEKVNPADAIIVEVPEPAAKIATPQDIPLDILHEDSDLIVLNKPAGMVVHPAAGNVDGTLVNALLHHCGQLSVIGGVERPGIVHRLDKETSGCLVVAKNDAAHRSLSAQFASRRVTKTYLAVVDGCPRVSSGIVDAPIGRHPIHRKQMAIAARGTPRPAITEYRVIHSSSGHALVECSPRTGRTHQIRVHLKSLGTPVSGDPVYGRRGSFTRHMLHAWKLSFEHPRTSEFLSFHAPIPPDFALVSGPPAAASS